jgi:hypothetical protein
MKNIFKPLIALFLVAVVVSSCKKEESKIYFEGERHLFLLAVQTQSDLSQARKPIQLLSFHGPILIINSPRVKFT